MTEFNNLNDVSLIDFLDSDPRPTFVLDREVAVASSESAKQPVYCNLAMLAADSGRLLHTITGKDDSRKTRLHESSLFSKFRRWVSIQHTDSNLSSNGKQFLYSGYTWVKVVIQDRWILVSGVPNNIDAGKQETTKSVTRFSPTLMNMAGVPQDASFSWTGKVLPLNPSPHVHFARNIHWAETPLGPMDTWSTELRNMANVVMKDPRPAVMFWGPEVVMLYNEPYVELLGELHPRCMGVSAKVGLAEVWHHFEPIIARNIAGESVEEVDTPIFLVRNGYLEEAYFSLKFIPILESKGTTVGHYESVIETVCSATRKWFLQLGSYFSGQRTGIYFNFLTNSQTRQKISQRRLVTLLELSEEVAKACDLDSYWALVTDVLSYNDKDIPFALLYSVTNPEDFLHGDTETNAPIPSASEKQYRLRGAIGVTADSLAAPSYLDLQASNGFMPYFRQAMQSQKHNIVQLNEGTLAAELLEGLTWRGFGDPCRTLVICPITPTSSDGTVLGFLVVGLNPRRPYDEDYRQFIQVFSRLLSTSLNSIVLHVEDIERRERAIARAEEMEFQLTRQLLLTQREVERTSLKFQRFAERADIGISISDLDGVFSYRNPAWFDIFQPKNRDLDLGGAWVDLIDDEYAKSGQEKFKALIEEKSHQCVCPNLIFIEGC
jgi:PAS domain-containing protein